MTPKEPPREGIGFTAWSNEENRMRKEKKKQENTALSKGKETQGRRGGGGDISNYLIPSVTKEIFSDL